MEQTAGRTGITFEQVAAVADAIAARGDRPTLRGVRAELGTGLQLRASMVFLARKSAAMSAM